MPSFEDVEIREVPIFADNLEQAEAVARFTIRELYHTAEPDKGYLGLFMGELEDRKTFAALSADSKILAVAGLAIADDSNEGVIVDVATDSGYRKRGLGKKVLNFAERVARESGVTHLVTHPIDSSVEFYRRLGFQEDTDRYVKFL